MEKKLLLVGVKFRGVCFKEHIYFGLFFSNRTNNLLEYQNI